MSKRTVVIAEHGITDIHPDYREWAIPGTYPRMWWEITEVPEDEYIERQCPRCVRYYKIKAGLFARLLRYQSEVVCYQCYIASKNHQLNVEIA